MNRLICFDCLVLIQYSIKRRAVHVKAGCPAVDGMLNAPYMLRVTEPGKPNVNFLRIFLPSVILTKSTGRPERKTVSVHRGDPGLVYVEFTFGDYDEN